jgi:hypothetical protein
MSSFMYLTSLSFIGTTEDEDKDKIGAEGDRAANDTTMEGTARMFLPRGGSYIRCNSMLYLPVSIYRLSPSRTKIALIT